MRKECVVGLCICLVLLGSLQAQWIAGWPQFTVSSLPEAVWAVASGERPGTGIDSLIDANTLKVSDWRSKRIWTFVCAGWPPLAFIYGELQLMRQDPKDLQSSKDASVKERTSTLKERSRDWSESDKANAQKIGQTLSKIKK